jgi:hypothetical protein
MGVLNEPIYSSLLLESFPRVGSNKEEFHSLLEAAYDAEYRQRVAALAKDCGVDLKEPIEWSVIALKLAERHVPGFQYESNLFKDPPKRGRPKRRLGKDVSMFIAMTKRIKKGLSIRQAAVHVARERGKGEKPDALDRRYRRVKERIKQTGARVEKLRLERERSTTRQII